VRKIRCPADPFENEIANLVHTSMQVQKVYLLPDNGGYLIKYRHPFVSLIRRESPDPLIWVIRFGVHVETHWRFISQICPIEKIERKFVVRLATIAF
jgi:hypothetical protein